jgi:transposase
MLYVRSPSEEERAELERLRRQAVGRVSQRAQWVLWSAQHRSVPEIALLTAASRATVRWWLRRFARDGPAGLYDAARSGRPRQLGTQHSAALTELIGHDPQEAGYLATVWTVGMLMAAVAQRLGVVVGVTALRTTVHRLGLRWGRPRLSMPRQRDPAKAAKQWTMVQAVVEAGPDATILYGDESRVQRLPLLRAMWHWAGCQVRVPTPGTNQSRMLLGALHIDTGQWVYLVREHNAAPDFLAFLEQVLGAYPAGPVVLIVDNYSSHTAHRVQDWLQLPEHARLRRCFLPTYCSHLNPVENIWRQLKGRLAADRLYASMPLLLDTVEAFFRHMTPEQALTWAA